MNTKSNQPSKTPLTSWDALGGSLSHLDGLPEYIADDAEAALYKSTTELCTIFGYERTNMQKKLGMWERKKLVEKKRKRGYKEYFYKLTAPNLTK
jgi:hypothetical protein